MRLTLTASVTRRPQQVYTGDSLSLYYALAEFIPTELPDVVGITATLRPMQQGGVAVVFTSDVPRTVERTVFDLHGQRRTELVEEPARTIVAVPNGTPMNNTLRVALYRAVVTLFADLIIETARLSGVTLPVDPTASDPAADLSERLLSAVREDEYIFAVRFIAEGLVTIIHRLDDGPETRAIIWPPTPDGTAIIGYGDDTSQAIANARAHWRLRPQSTT